MQIEYHNSTRLLAVIGDPIAHSLSPLLHNAMAKALGLDYLYLACRVRREDLPRWLESVKTLNIAGFNATMPHKVDLFDLLRQSGRLTEEAMGYGAVNTVRWDGQCLTGHNTDGDGFARSMADYGVAFPDANVTILGAGGAASSIALKAASSGAKTVRVMNRTVKKAEALCAKFPQMTAMALTEPVPPDTDILINTLPVGAAPDPALLEPLSRDCAVFDILYAPPKTDLLLAAEARGMRAVNGLGMLVYQAIYAFVFFTGAEVDDAAMGRLLMDTVQAQ